MLVEVSKIKIKSIKSSLHSFRSNLIFEVVVVETFTKGANVVADNSDILDLVETNGITGFLHSTNDISASSKNRRILASIYTNHLFPVYNSNSLKIILFKIFYLFNFNLKK